MARIRLSLRSTRHQLASRSLVAVLMILVLTGAGGLAQDVTGTFVPVEVQGAPFTVARAITADGRIVGFFGVVNGPQHGFLLVDGTFTTIDVPVPDARWTNVSGSTCAATSSALLETKTSSSMDFSWRPTEHSL